jgi:hypothetical protein
MPRQAPPLSARACNRGRTRCILLRTEAAGSPLAVGEHSAATISCHEKEERRAATQRSVQQGGLECPPTFKGLASLSKSRRDPLTANREYGDTCPVAC